MLSEMQVRDAGKGQVKDVVWGDVGVRGAGCHSVREMCEGCCVRCEGWCMGC